MDGYTGEFLACVTDDETSTLALAVDAANVDDEDAKERCHDECQALEKYCCNDPDVGSNQLLSCAQACMIRTRGTDASTCTMACDDQDASRGCTRTVNGYSYSMCSSCDDLDDTCPHGVQEGAGACQDGCVIEPLQTTQTVPIAGQCCAHSTVGETCYRQLPGLSTLLDLYTGCIAGHDPIEPMTYSQVYIKCLEHGLEMCEGHCPGDGCGYNNYPVWTRLECAPPPPPPPLPRWARGRAQRRRPPSCWRAPA